MSARPPAEVRLVVTNGCSFTYGTCLEDRQRSTWGRQVADALGANFVNLAAGGGSNRRLVRTTVSQLPRVTAAAGLEPANVLFLGMWAELPRWEVYDPRTPDPVAQPESFVDRPWHRIGLWAAERRYRPAVEYYRYLQHDEGDLLDLLLGHVLLGSYLSHLDYSFGFLYVADLLPPDIRSTGYEDLIGQLDESRVLGGWDAAGRSSFLRVIEEYGLPMSGRPPGATRGNGHPLEEAHRVYARDWVLPFARRLARQLP